MDILNYIVPSKNFKHEEGYLDILFMTLLHLKKNIGSVSFYNKKDMDLLDVIESKNFLCFRFSDNSNKHIIEYNNGIYDIKSKYETNFNFIDSALENMMNIIFKYHLDNTNPLIIGVFGENDFVTKLFLHNIKIYIHDNLRFNKRIYYLRDIKTNEKVQLNKVQKHFVKLCFSEDFDKNYANYILSRLKAVTLEEANLIIKTKRQKANVEINQNFKPFGYYEIKLDDIPKYDKNFFFGIEEDVKKKISGITTNSIYVRNIISKGNSNLEKSIYLYLIKIVRLKALIRYSNYLSVINIAFKDNFTKEEIENALNVNDLLFNNDYIISNDSDFFYLFGLFSDYAIKSPDFFINKIKFEYIKEEGMFLVNSNNEIFDLDIGDPEKYFHDFEYEWFTEYIQNLFIKITNHVYGVNISIKINLKLNFVLMKDILDQFFNLSGYMQSNINDIIFSSENNFFELYKRYFREK